MITSCKTLRREGPSSGTLVDHGIVLNESDYPAVRRLSVSEKSGCTITFISQTVAITAAHCFLKKTGTPTVGSLQISAEEILVHNEYAAQPGNHDLALLRFPLLEEMPPVVLSLTPLATGEVVSLVGYGYDTATMWKIGEGVDRGPPPGKRLGSNRYVGLRGEAGEIHISGKINDSERKLAGRPGTDATSGPGGSGGPLFNAKLELVATVVGGNTSPCNEEKDKNSCTIFTDISSESNQAFLRRAVRKGFGIPTTCCICKATHMQKVAFWPDKTVATYAERAHLEIGRSDDVTLCSNLTSRPVAASGQTYDIPTADQYLLFEGCQMAELSRCK